MVKRALRHIDRIEEYVTLTLFLTMSAFVMIQIVSRYLMRSPLKFPDEVARHAYVWLTFIGLSLSTKHGDHIRVDIVGIALRGRALAIVNRVVEVGTLIILVSVAILGYRYARFTAVNRWPSMPQLSMALVSVSFPLGFTVAALRMIQIIFRPANPAASKE